MRSSCLCTRYWKGNHPSPGVFPPHLLHELRGKAVLHHRHGRYFECMCVCEEGEEATDSLATPPTFFLSAHTYTHRHAHTYVHACTHTTLLDPVSEPSPVSNLLLISCQLESDDEVIIVGGGR